MTQQEPTVAPVADEILQKKLSIGAQQNGSEEAATGHVAEVEQESVVENPTPTEPSKDDQEASNGEKAPAPDSATGVNENVVEQSDGTTNGASNAPSAALAAEPADEVVPTDEAPSDPIGAEASSSAAAPADAEVVGESASAEPIGAQGADPADTSREPESEVEASKAAADEDKADDKLSQPEEASGGGQEDPKGLDEEHGKTAPEPQEEGKPEEPEPLQQSVGEKEAQHEKQEPEPEQQNADGPKEEPAADTKSDDVLKERSSEPVLQVKNSVEPTGEVTSSSEPAVNGNPPVAATEAVETAEGTKEDSDASLTSPGIVQAISRRLSSNSLQGQTAPTTPSKATPADKGVPPTAVAAVGTAVAPGKAAKSPTAPRSGEASPISTHDTKNTINVSQLLKLGAFKMQPLRDFVPYAELLRLRVEDGIDATRKEDYLNDADFQQVFGMDRDAFKKQPAWRQHAAKKKANLF